MAPPRHPHPSFGTKSRVRVKRRSSVVAGLSALTVAMTAGAALAACGSGGPAAASATTLAQPVGSASPAPRQTLTGTATPEARRAAAAYDAFTRAYYSAANGRARYSDTPGTGTAVFWRQAELIEMTEDAYQAAPSPALKQQIVALMSGVTWQYGHNWTRRTWNDDIMWMIIAAARAYQLTGDRAYLAMAKKNFDITYARAWSADFGGGLWWISGGPGRRQKNVTTNATAAIAAAELAAALHSQAYLSKAEGLYAWLRKTLYDPRTGAVWDSISPKKTGGGTVTNKAALTYNQGTFTGAAGLLYQATHKKQYLNDGTKAIAYTRDVMAKGGVLPAEAGGNGNLFGFKGIFSRWAVGFARQNRIATFDQWFRLNAAAALGHRNAEGLIGPDWTQTMPTSAMDSWGASSAVVLLELLARP
jgi:predicted alpha-1,6-mannanase (GH76 family)